VFNRYLYYVCIRFLNNSLLSPLNQKQNNFSKHWYTLVFLVHSSNLKLCAAIPNQFAYDLEDFQHFLNWYFLQVRFHEMFAWNLPFVTSLYCVYCIYISFMWLLLCYYLMKNNLQVNIIYDDKTLHQSMYAMTNYILLIKNKI